MMKMRAWLASACLAAAMIGCGGPEPTLDGGGDASNEDGGTTSDGGRDGGRDGGTDPCEGLTLCTTEGVSCDGDELVTCAEDANGCLVETSEDCGVAGDVCDESGTTPACVDECDLIPAAMRCDTAGRVCNGDSLEICAANAEGCLVLEATDCATMDPVAECDDTGTMPVCAVPDPCEGVTQCGTAETRVCGDSDTVTVCAADAAGCFVETTMDCTGGQVCDGTTVTCVDPCSLVDVCPAATYCDATGELVTCAADVNGCLVEMDRDTCGAGTACAAPTGLAPACRDTLCPEAVPTVIDCATGTISGNTAQGSAIRTSYTGCSSSTLYSGREQFFVFRNGQPARVTVSVTPTAAGDFDLFALDAGDGTATCGASSLTCEASDTTAPSATEPDRITFDVTPGDTKYVVYDRYDNATDTTAFDLAVTCVVGVCGDGNREVFEPCDDGNTAAGDGCSATCTVEPFYLCTGTMPSTCVASCGNGTVNAGAGETCDDMNAVATDGCDACVRAPGYSCTGSPSVCTFVCGDGTLNTSIGETCDDANVVAGDGCSALCATESGFTCVGAGATSCQMTAPNAVCSGAIALTGTRNGDTLRAGGPRPTGAGCGTSAGPVLYYTVTVDPGTETTVTATPTGTAFDLTLRSLATCGATCLTAIDVNGSSLTTGAERLVLANTGAAAVTYTVAVGADSTTTLGTFDISLATRTFAPNATCAGAIALTTSLTAQDLNGGGARPTGTNCASSAGRVLYYSVEVPANSATTVTATPSTAFDVTLRSLAECGSGNCLAAVDTAGSGTGATAADSITLLNAGATPITQYVAVGADSSTAFGTFDLASSTIALAANASCAGAASLTGTLTGQDLAVGGPRPSGTSCGGGTGTSTLYYSITIPPVSEGTIVVTRTGATTWDPVVLSLTDCAATNCSSAVDTTSATETMRITNPGATAITRIIAVRNYGAPRGTFDIAFSSAPLQFVSITAACADMSTGTAVTTSDEDDGVSTRAALPFSFSLQGSTATHYVISTNGTLQLLTSDSGTGLSAASNDAIPDSDAPNLLVAAFWDDLIGASVTGPIRVLTTGTAPNRTFVVEWSGMATFSTSGSVLTFQAHLLESGPVELHYCSMVGTGTRATGDSATVGIENAAGTAGVGISYNTAGGATTGTGYRIMTP